MDERTEKCRSRFKNFPKWIFFFLLLLIFCQFVGIGFAMQRAKGAEEALFGLLIPAAAVSICAAGVISMQWVKFRQFAWLKKALDPGKEHRQVPFWVLWLGCILFWLPYFLAFYPGILCYDFDSQVGQYFHTQFYVVHHPVAHTFLMSWLIDVGYGLFGSFNAGSALYIVLQMLGLSASVAYALSRVQNFRIPRWMFWGMVVVFYVLPLFPVMAISATKDTVFAALFMMAMVTACSLTRQKIRLWDAVLFVLFAAGSALMRNNVIYGYAVVLVICAVQVMLSKRKKCVIRMTALILMAMIVTLLSNAALEKALNAAETGMKEKLSIPAQQLVRTYTYNKDSLSENHIEVIEKYVKEQGLAVYDPCLADNAKENLNLERISWDPGKFFRLWLSIGKDNLEEYMEAFLVQNEPLWYFGNKSLLKAKECYLEIGFATDYLEGLHEDSKLPGLKTQVTKLVGGPAEILRIPVVSMLLHPATFTWLMLAALALMLQEKKIQNMFLIMIPLCYYATLLMGPCILPRYCLAVMMSVPVIVAFIIHNMQEEQETV